MAKFCTVCGKGPMSGFNVSHSNRHTKRRWLPNLQSMKVLINGAPRRVRVCTSCIKASKVQQSK